LLTLLDLSELSLLDLLRAFGLLQLRLSLLNLRLDSFEFSSQRLRINLIKVSRLN
jgi:hypothetical protein